MSLTHSFEYEHFPRVEFAPNVAPMPGDLIGLDILQHFDLALFHSHRTGLIGWSR